MAADTDPAAAELEARIRQRHGALIRKARMDHGWTMIQLATATDTTEGSVYAWESGRSTPRQATQLRIAEALGVRWSELFDLDVDVA